MSAKSVIVVVSDNEQSAKKQGIYQKTVRYGSESLTLFSLDGQTWSTNKKELYQIKLRQEQQRNAISHEIKHGQPIQNLERPLSKKAGDKAAVAKKKKEIKTKTKTKPKKLEIITNRVKRDIPRKKKR
ncbi:MAG TPA: hypothetical protein PKD37_05990 [Oligoflexia bacterium]|nr:hypothetical protein [Oligoflexia bacterium]HMP27511.1 hypothetical protein [Oligoflexia bacterium]